MQPSLSVDLGLKESTAISTRDFPLPWPEEDAVAPWPWSAECWLSDEVRDREREEARLLGNYLVRLANKESHQTWRKLYRLSPAVIDRLRKRSTEPNVPEFLKSLPRADLHRHLGGCLDLHSQRQVEVAILENLSSVERQLL